MPLIRPEIAILRSTLKESQQIQDHDEVYAASTDNDSRGHTGCLLAKSVEGYRGNSVSD